MGKLASAIALSSLLAVPASAGTLVDRMEDTCKSALRIRLEYGEGEETVVRYATGYAYEEAEGALGIITALDKPFPSGSLGFSAMVDGEAVQLRHSAQYRHIHLLTGPADLPAEPLKYTVGRYAEQMNIPVFVQEMCINAIKELKDKDALTPADREEIMTCADLDEYKGPPVLFACAYTGEDLSWGLLRGTHARYGSAENAVFRPISYFANEMLPGDEAFGGNAVGAPLLDFTYGTPEVVGFLTDHAIENGIPRFEVTPAEYFFDYVNEN